jgi:hypothetical protein
VTFVPQRSSAALWPGVTAAGRERALVALWPEVPTQRCTVHKHLCGRLFSSKAFLLARCFLAIASGRSFIPTVDHQCAGAQSSPSPATAEATVKNLAYAGDLPTAATDIGSLSGPLLSSGASRAAETNDWSGIRSVAALCPAYLRGVRRWPSWVYARVPGTNPQGVLRGTDACPVLPGLS